MTEATVVIGDRRIGSEDPPFVIAEAGANHDGDLDRAKRLIDAAATANADAIKFQNYTAEKLVTKSAPKYWGDRETTQYETFAKLDCLVPDDYREMARYARKEGLIYLSTPFDRGAVNLLADLQVPAYKIASGDLTHHPLLEYVAAQGEPVVLSTGMATLEEIRAAVSVIESTGNEDIVLLHCVTEYPTPVEEANLRMMRTLDDEFDYPVGLSDHTMGTTVPTAAAALGAAVIEKHFTFDTTLQKSPDHRLSADTDEMAEIVDRTRDAHAALGRSEQGPTDRESEGLAKARRSLVTGRAFQAGEAITTDGLAVKRPGTGIAPQEYWTAGEETWRAVTDLAADRVLTWDDIERDE